MSRGSEMGTRHGEGTGGVHVTVDPGICVFECGIRARKEGREVRFDIQSQCDQIRKLAPDLGPVNMKDLFVPVTRNPIFLCAEKSRCHLACPIPSSLVKTAEVVLGLALPKEVTIRFGTS